MQAENENSLVIKKTEDTVTVFLITKKKERVLTQSNSTRVKLVKAKNLNNNQRFYMNN